MTMINETIEPDLKGAERQELSHLDYFRRKIEELRDRGLIAGNSFETISSEIRLRREAIDRHGVYRAQLGRARKLVATKNLAGAKEWAERARLTEPDQREAWELEVSVSGTLDRYDDAIALCKKAVERFPDMAATLLQLRQSNSFAAMPSRSAGRTSPGNASCGFCSRCRNSSGKSPNRSSPAMEPSHPTSCPASTSRRHLPFRGRAWAASSCWSTGRS